MAPHTAVSASASARLLPWFPLATRLAYRWSDTPSDVDDLRQEGLWALHRALDREPTLINPSAFAHRVLEQAMWRYRRRRPLGLAPADVGRAMPLCSVRPQVEEQLELDDYFTALERQCGPAARSVAHQLVAPSGAVAALLGAEAQGKQARRLVGRRCRREIPREIVRRGLALSRRRWRVLIIQIETFTRSWLASA